MAGGFVHLHTHSQFSLLDGSCRPEDLIRRALEDGQPAVAITDHGNLFGAVRFHDLARQAGIKPILGVEAYVATGSRHDRGAAGEGRGRKPYHHMVLLARNLTGYRNLLHLVSSAYTEGFYYRPRMDRELLAAHSEGLIATSACLGGEIPQLLLAGRAADAERAADGWREVFGADSFFIELQDQGIAEERQILPELLALAGRTGLPLLATNDCHYLDAADHFAHDVLICIQTGKTVGEPRSLRFTDQHYFKSRAEMWQRFGDTPAALENTVRVAAECDVLLPKGEHHLPAFQVPVGTTPAAYFETVVAAGFASREPEWAKRAAAGQLRQPLSAYRERLRREIDCIEAMGFAGYFLIVWDLIRHARQQGIPVGPGRGSAAGSLVAYCLRITDVDPLQYDLLFERFLNPERVSLPDIDIDFCMRGRGRVIDYVTAKYGRDNVAQIITFGTMAARAVIRDAGRGLNIPYARVDRIAKLVPGDLDASIDSALESVAELREIHDGDPEIRRLLDVGRRLEGLPRHASTHAAGVVIAPGPITNYAPLYQVREGERTTQYSMGDIERIGLLKMDFLGLKTLTLIDDAQRLLVADGHPPVDWEAVGLQDEATYALFSRGATGGIFQFESDGMKDILRKLRPERYEDLIALNALYRPGPLKGGLVDMFIRRRHGKEKVEYVVPQLRAILAETYGVIVYQEQVMQIASELGGFSLGEADLLRRAMGKKDLDLLAGQRARFLSGALARGIRAAEAEAIFGQMEHFAGYGFNKSHSAAYALVAYQTAYLKAHHPVPFMAALLTSEKGHTEKLVGYLAECREIGITVQPPHINASGMDFTPEGAAIRFGLSAIRNVGEAAIEQVLAARARLGRVSSLAALARAVDLRLVNKRVFEALIRSGSLDELHPVRARLAAALDGALEAGQKARQDEASGQGSLFTGGAPAAAADAPLPEAEPWTDHETLAYEKESLGFYLSGHPLVEFAREVDEFGTHSTEDLRSARGGEAVAVAGLVAGLRKRRTRKGDWMAVASLEDLHGLCEVVVFPELAARVGGVLREDAAVLVCGRAEAPSTEERGRVLAEDILPLGEVRERRARAVSIALEAPGLDEDILQRLRVALEAHAGDIPVSFVLTQPDGFRATLRPVPDLRVRPGTSLTQAIEDLLGPGTLKLRAGL